jgi:GxxExxY protein
MTDEEIGHAIVGGAMKVHSAVGPGLLESAYETCLAYELEKHGIVVRKQVPVPIRYEDLVIENAYRIDLLVGDAAPVGAKKIQGHDGLWRLRFGNYRIVYAVPDANGVIQVLKIAQRGSAYKRL